VTSGAKSEFSPLFDPPVGGHDQVLPVSALGIEPAGSLHHREDDSGALVSFEGRRSGWQALAGSQAREPSSAFIGEDLAVAGRAEVL
jgi:hypothetical protein